MNSSGILAIGILIGAGFAIAGLFRPFLGVIVFMLIHFVQPGELIPALAPLRIELVYGALLIIVVFWRQLSTKPPSLLQDKILFSSLLLIGAGIFSVPFSVWPGGAAATVLNMVKLVVLILLLIMVVDSKDRLRRLLWCMTAVGAWFAGSSLFAYIHGQFYALKYAEGNLARAEGVNSIVGGPNELAGLLLALLPLLIALLRTSRSILGRILLIGCGAATLAAISLAGSRIAMIGLIAMAAYYTIQSKRKLLTLLACIVIGCITWGLLPSEYRTRYITVEHYASGGNLDASNEFRLQVWRAGGQIFLHRPIFGVGAGQFSTAYGLTYLGEGKHRKWMNPHNLLIQTACELGMVGVVIFGNFLWQIAKGIRYVFLRRKMSGTRLNYEMAVACSVMYVGVVILSLVGHTLYRPYWYLLAGLVAANRNLVIARVKVWRQNKVTAESRPATISEEVANTPMNGQLAI
jgi:O-antigen ligase